MWLMFRPGSISINPSLIYLNQRTPLIITFTVALNFTSTTLVEHQATEQLFLNQTLNFKISFLETDFAA